MQYEASGMLMPNHAHPKYNIIYLVTDVNAKSAAIDSETYDRFLGQGKTSETEKCSNSTCAGSLGDACCLTQLLYPCLSGPGQAVLSLHMQLLA